MSFLADFPEVILSVARRHMIRTITTPHLSLPLVLFPLLMFAAFVGSASAISRTPSFDYYSYTAFIFVYALMQSASASGVAIGLAVAQDFESGFARRMLLSTQRRSALVVGYVLGGLAQQLCVAAILFVVALAVGMTIHGNVLQVAGLFVLASLFNVAASLYATGVALRARSTQVGPAMQIPMLVPLFFAPVFAPRTLLTDWLHTVADFNPVTFLLEAGRGLIAGNPVSLALAFGIAGGLSALFSLWALSGLRSAERAA